MPLLLYSICFFHVSSGAVVHLQTKYGENKLLKRMYELVRQNWEEERIPEEWKETIIVPIHKKRRQS